MLFEKQELPDIIRVIVLLNLTKGTMTSRPLIKRRIDTVCAGYACIEMSDLARTRDAIAAEGLISLSQKGTVELTEKARAKHTKPDYNCEKHNIK